MTRTTEREISEPIDLCVGRGRLNAGAVGWSRHPLHRCNLRGRWLAKKRWQSWAIATETHFFSVSVSHLDYAGVVFVYFADLERGKLIEKTVIRPLGRGCVLPESPQESLKFQDRELWLEVAQDTDRVRLRADLANIEGHHLSAEFSIVKPQRHESLNVVVPWEGGRFQFSSKQNTLPANGFLRIGEREVAFDGSQCFASQDFGRGVWPRNSRWNWAQAAGTRNGRLIGLQLGGGWTDGTGITDNALCVDGVLSKISEELHWEFDRNNFMNPWRIVAPSSLQVNLTFSPLLERVPKARLGPLGSEVHQVFGRFNGVVTTATRENLAIGDLSGWVEDHVARW